MHGEYVDLKTDDMGLTWQKTTKTFKVRIVSYPNEIRNRYNYIANK